MLEIVGAVLALSLLLLRHFLKPRPKAAREVLSEESPTAKAIEEAEKRAEEKFGPRPE